jgi:hypothetical protein
LEPRIGATSSISVVPKGNASPAAANGGASKRQNNTSKARQQRTIIGTPRPRLGAHERLFHGMRMAGTGPGIAGRFYGDFLLGHLKSLKDLASFCQKGREGSFIRSGLVPV